MYILKAPTKEIAYVQDTASDYIPRVSARDGRSTRYSSRIMAQSICSAR